MKRVPKLTIVVPAYNEEEGLATTVTTLLDIEKQLIPTKIAPTSDILVVNDGSQDKTWQVISELHQDNSRVHGLSFTRNYGHQNALLAGMEEAVNQTDIIITIDADLQDDPQAIPSMVAAYEAGNDIVYGVRNNRDTDTWFKRTTAHAYYRLLHLMGVKLVADHADYRLMSRRAVQALLSFPERNIFLRGLIPLLGFKSTKVYYRRGERIAGESKYPLKRMVAFAWDGITSFSVAPIRLLMFGGIGMNLLSIVMCVYTLSAKIFHLSVQGWSSLMISLWFIGGAILIGIGLISEYLGKVMLEVKQRPRYFIKERI